MRFIDLKLARQTCGLSSITWRIVTNIQVRPFSQLMEFVPRYEFRKCINLYHGSTSKMFLMLGAVSQHGVCFDLQGKSTRHRILPACHRKNYIIWVSEGWSRATLANANSVSGTGVFMRTCQIMIGIAALCTWAKTGFELAKRFTRSTPQR